jgi:hypothetical protein
LVSYFSKLAHDFGFSESSSKAEDVVVSVISLSSLVQEGWSQESFVIVAVVVSVVVVVVVVFQSEEASCAGFVEAIDAQEPPVLSKAEEDEEDFCPELYPQEEAAGVVGFLE